jgi:DNA-binding CsgD family transcriptional regulator
MKLDMTKSKVKEFLNEFYLTEEEKEVLQLWLEGRSIVETSLITHLSISTITRRRKSIREKYNKFNEYNMTKR